MSSPFANGSSIPAAMRAAQPGAAPQPAPAVQPAGEYFRQSYVNSDGDMAAVRRGQQAEQLLERGRQLAGFVSVGRHGDPDGVRLERRLQPSWPAELPQHVRQAIDRAIADHAAAYSANQAALMGYRQWEQAHPDAPDEVRRVEAYRQIADQKAAADRAGAQRDKVLTAAAAIVEAIEHRRAVEGEAPRKRATIEREYQKQLEQVDRDLQAARLAQQQAISAF